MKSFILILIIVGVIGGGYYYEHHKATVDSAFVDATKTKDQFVADTTEGVDQAIAGALKSIAPVSLLYYTNNRNYGVSMAKNICNDTSAGGSIGSVIAGIQKYTKAISCVTDADFPAKSFTLVAPSVANKGKYYCTDQNGVVTLIPSVAPSSNFKAGLACK